jgi:hypothetical protein
MEDHADNPTQPTVEAAGGVGGLFSRVDDVASDARIIARAVADRWPITPEVRRQAVEAVAKILRAEKVPKRTRLAAVRTLALLDRLNLVQEAHDDPPVILHEHEHTVTLTVEQRRSAIAALLTAHVESGAGGATAPDAHGAAGRPHERNGHSPAPPAAG